MDKQFLVIFLAVVILVSGCSQSPAQPNTVAKTNEINSDSHNSPANLNYIEKKLLVGIWGVASSVFNADDTLVYPTPSHVNKLTLKPDKTWLDDNSNKGTWSVEKITENDWNVWVWDTSATKPENKVVLKGDSEASGWIDENREHFWVFYRFDGNAETQPGQIQLYFEKISNEIIAPTGLPASPQDPEVTKTKYVADIESKLLGEWYLNRQSSRKLALTTGKWELLPEIGGSSGLWELKDVTKTDIQKWKEEGVDVLNIASKKIVFHDRKCSEAPKTEEVYIAVDESGIYFESCGALWQHW